MTKDEVNEKISGIWWMVTATWWMVCLIAISATLNSFNNMHVRQILSEEKSVNCSCVCNNANDDPYKHDDDTDNTENHFP